MEKQERDLRSEIMKYLLNLKIKNTSVGFCYWINAIYYCAQKLQQNRYSFISMNEIYTYISKVHVTTISNAEKAMRYAKEKSQYLIKLNLSENIKNHEFLLLSAEKFLIQKINNVS